MAIELITGRAGTPHVDSADVGALNAALFGAGAYVLEGIDAELVDANNVRVSAGEMLCEGRHIRITGDGETLTIDNGTSAYKRHDIIAAKYLRGEEGVETVTLVVVKGSNSTNAPQDPAMPRQGKVIDGAAEAYWPLYRIVVDGLTPQTPAFIAQRQAAYMLGLGTEIPAGADLNDYTTPGKYVSLYGVSSNNSPFDGDNHGIYQVFDLIVSSVDGGGSVIQRIQTMDGLLYSRLFTGSWTSWKCNGGIDSIVAEGTTNGWYWEKYAGGRCCMRKFFYGMPNTTGISPYGYGLLIDDNLPFPTWERKCFATGADWTTPAFYVQTNYSEAATDFHMRFLSHQNQYGLQGYVLIFGEWK